MKKMNNKGFSLVELIIVIAIMAVLMGVLAPQLLKYVEESRVQADASTFSEVENATKIALSLDDIYDSVADGTTVTISDGAKVASTNADLQAELLLTFPDDVDLTSKTFSSTGGKITIKMDPSTMTFSVTNDWDATLAAM
ncbi:MAG: prepilin-type N-terminal cleavage/methylation domain-containing protein [Lachnospiraceae bacterium]|nr:prepilin-type N-terminal cleavage/methylation domain-containing protein [Lachnospiraceae bacterium]